MVGDVYSHEAVDIAKPVHLNLPEDRALALRVEKDVLLIIL